MRSWRLWLTLGLADADYASTLKWLKVLRLNGGGGGGAEGRRGVACFEATLFMGCDTKRTLTLFFLFWFGFCWGGGLGYESKRKRFLFLVTFCLFLVRGALF